MANAVKKTTILVVDDAADTLEMLQRKLASEGYNVLAAADGARAVKVLEERRVELVITDLKMPGVNGLELVRYVRENFKNTKVMMVTGYPSIESAVGAVKSGAEEYLAKPFTDEELFAAVRRALEKLLGRGAEAGRAGRATAARFGIIGESEATRKLIEDMDKAASASAAVLITGESGTGKELVARAIHYQSARAAAPFVPVNCGAIPERLLESELFGYVRGAFTGAAETRPGFFQTAAGGTIFLDEISEMSPAMQVKLLRVLDTKQVYMVGSRRPDELDVRLVAATNRELAALVEKGAFREDLFYRLNVITVEVPPLRRRPDDVVPLARYFAARFARELGKPAPEFTAEVLAAFKGYYWPGNVRQLENTVQRLLVMADGDVVDVGDLPGGTEFLTGNGEEGGRTLAEVAAGHIAKVLSSVGGNKSRAAAILGIDRRTLRKKLAISQALNPS